MDYRSRREERDKDKRSDWSANRHGGESAGQTTDRVRMIKEVKKYSFYLKFLKYGQLPTSQDSMNSWKREEGKQKELLNKLEQLKLVDSLEFDYLVGTSTVRLKKRIHYLQNLKLQDLTDWVEEVQEAIRVAKWSAEDSLEIVRSLIKIPMSKKKNYKDVIELFQDLYDEVYGNSDISFYQRQLNKVTQSSFYWVEEYIEGLKRIIFKLSFCKKMGKKEFEDKFEEAFMFGLSVETKIEMKRLGIEGVEEMIKKIQDTEEIIKEHIKNATTNDLEEDEKKIRSKTAAAISTKVVENQGKDIFLKSGVNFIKLQHIIPKIATNYKIKELWKMARILFPKRKTTIGIKKKTKTKNQRDSS